MDKIDHLRREIAKRESELADLKSQLAVAESEYKAGDEVKGWPWPLQDHEYQRYGRQMIVPSFGLQAQLRLKKSRVLVVGAGGLGCPAAAYLAGAGVGVLGLVDADQVEVSNLHRQVAHSTGRVGMSKVLSAKTYLRELNPAITYKSHQEHLSARNARAIVSQYDVVLDCTDHPTSRYLVSDACVLLGRPLVSASAFQTSGQLIVLNSPPGRGPCYRCVFPRPPPPESVVGCGEGGVLGPVVGVMGVLQALEAMRLIARGALEAAAAEEAEEQRMLIFSAAGEGPSFRSVRMRGRRKDCFACSAEGGLSLEHLETSVDYVQFCGVAKPVALLRPEERITAEQYREIRASRPEHTLLDVREKEHFSLGSIPGAVNVPFSRFNRGDEMPELTAAAGSDGPIYVVCRVGNDSQAAARQLKDLGFDNGGERFIGDISGGMQAWREAVDPTLPFL
ncbi:Adenylyltransferase and sulfurtransferase uba4 [Tolypocladium paradoxum]|uniref:Adenylyltransferase and sulfurtransferase uba4 n=1 Tax=Tolypocladium paradoxum TaxID=94208 RepID=A0A2S4L7U9_9HYPO|nr:Adenylyltransferase and sulfurtransferase uba4 [Tolypocladium paradoxum]